MKKRRPWHLIIFFALLVVWLPAVILIHGAAAVPYQIGLGFEVFISMTVIIVPIWGVLTGIARAIEFALDTPRRSRRERIGRGLCGNCGYSLQGNESGICPECGEAIVRASDQTVIDNLHKLSGSP